jgi:uncharacterized protein YjlB
MSGSVAGLVEERFADDGTFPNSGLPLLLYRAALPSSDVSPEAIEAMFRECGWPPAWRSSVFTYHHFHSTAHEALGIAAGGATLMLGGPKGREVEVTAGDVIVIPAGVAHKRLSSKPGFLVVGAYPPGQDWDLLTGAPGERPGADHNIARVPLPDSDPVAGRDGPLLRLWQ